MERQHLEPSSEDLAREHSCRGSKGLLHLLIDSTGMKGEGEGEWHSRKHGGPKRRLWRKIHLGIDEQTLEIRAIEITGSMSAMRRCCPSCRTLRVESSQSRGTGRFVHVVVGPGDVLVLPAWMLDPVACAGMRQVGPSQVSISARGDLHDLLSRRGFRRSSPGDAIVSKEEQDDRSQGGRRRPRQLMMTFDSTHAAQLREAGSFAARHIEIAMRDANVASQEILDTLYEAESTEALHADQTA